MNSVALFGRLTADPTVHAGEQHESCVFRLAVPKPGSDDADFVDIVTFDKLTSVCAEWLTKGREVAVVGKLRLSEWTGRDGERSSKLQVSTPTKPEVSPGLRVADAVEFLGSPKKAGDPDGAVASDDKPAVGAYRRKASSPQWARPPSTVAAPKVSAGRR